MYQFVPHFILSRYAAGQTQGAFPAVGLFADISGFSAMTDALMAHGQHGAEVLAGVMRSAFTPLFHSVYGQGGFIATRAGDAFTALFPLEDDEAQRALAAAWSIQKRAAEQPSHATVYGAFAVSVKVGLALGEVNWGIVNSKDGRRAIYYFQGSAIDGCAGAEHHARAGEVILEAGLAQRLQDFVEVEEVADCYRLTRVDGELPEVRPVDLPEPDIDLVARFLPRELITQPSGGEFRQIAHLFINLPTVRTEAQLAIFMQTLFELQDSYGGLLNRLDFGDKGSNLLLFWGVPKAYENDVKRCLNFVLELQAQTSIPISAGVTYQLAHAGLTGSELSEEYTCFGRGVNLAARFMMAAPRGEIWLDEGAARRAERHFELEFAGEESFKGFSKIQKIYTLLERKRESEPIFLGEMLGRSEELNRLAEFVQPIFAGQYAGVLVVWGEPGIGKSRLVHQFLDDLTTLRSNDFTWALCQTDEILRQSLNPFSYWLKHYFEQSIEQSEARNKRNFNRRLDELIEATTNRDLAAELDRTRSFLGTLLDLSWPDSLYEQLDAKGRYENTFIAVTTFIKARSSQQPLILFIEDVHWLDDDSKDFLPHLIRALKAEEHQAYPIAILATARYEGQGLPISDTLPGQEINLRGLPGEDLSRMAADLLGKPGSPALLDILTRLAEGNPFFAEQILRYLQEEGLLKESESGWTVPEQKLERSPLPADVRAILAARLDRLAQEVRAAVQTAAVLGREFEVRLLARMLQDDENLPHKMAQAEQAAIWTTLDELRYIFKHALLRDAAYHMQLRARRAQLHQLAAAALEQVYAGELNFHYGELAYHSEKGGLAEQARSYLRLAGEAAQEAYQNHLAINYYSRALKLTPAGDLQARYALHQAREAIYNLMGKREEQLQDLLALQSLAIEMGDRDRQIEAKGKRAEYLAVIGDYREAYLAAEAAIALAEEAGAWKTTLLAYNAACEALYKQGDYENAIRWGQRGIALARQYGDRSIEARLLNKLGIIHIEQQDFDAAKTYSEQSLDIFVEIGDVRNQGMPLNNLGMLSGYMGDYDAAERYYEQSLALAQKIGHRTGEGIVLGNLGWVAGALGDFARARTYGEQMIRIARESGSRFSELYGSLNLSMFTEKLGEGEIALTCAERALELARQNNDRNGEAWALTYQGHARLALKQYSAAATAYRAALDIRQELDQPVLATEPAAGLALISLEEGDLAAARNHVNMILAQIDRDGALTGADEPLRVYLAGYQVLAAGGEERAEAILEKAHAMLLARAEGIKDEQKRLAFLENIPYHRQILEAWKRQQDER